MHWLFLLGLWAGVGTASPQPRFNASTVFSSSTVASSSTNNTASLTTKVGHANFPTNPTITRPFSITAVHLNSTDAPGLESASSCLAWKYSYLSANGTTVTSTTEYVTTSQFALSSTSFWVVTHALRTSQYTLCDGFPRVDRETSEETIASTSTWNTTSTSTTTVLWTLELPSPSCVIPQPECDVMQRSYSAALTAYNSDLSMQSTDGVGWTALHSHPPYPESSPICGPSVDLSQAPRSLIGSPVCIHSGNNSANVKLFYWPVSRLPGWLCASNRSAVTMGPTIPGKPNTAVVGGTTLTSPTVYMG